MAGNIDGSFLEGDGSKSSAKLVRLLEVSLLDVVVGQWA